MQNGCITPQGGRTGHEGPHSPVVAWRGHAWELLWAGEAAGGCLSICIEGACRALARVKVHSGKMDAEKLVTDGPPEGKEHRKPEMYYEGVLKGARLVADECSQDVIFE